MSNIDNAFKEIRIEHGLKQKPNSIGTVYGMCMTKLCANYHKIGYYTGGFCKKCSTRHPEDKKKYVLKGIDRKGTIITIPNPEIRWITKTWVHDLSDRLSKAERDAFYGSPEEWERTLERLERRESLEKGYWDDQDE